MADDKVNDVNIGIGVHLSVVVEYCIENIISVCLKHKGKEFRGVLLQCNAGLYPGSLSFPSPCKLRCLKQSDGSQAHESSPAVSHPEKHLPCANNDGQRTEIPPVAQRFSYSNDPYHANHRASPELTVVEMKPVGPRKRTIRDIRLRPRQTLCSNCKCAIHEGKKNRNAALPVEAQKETVAEVGEKRLRTRAQVGTSSALQLPDNPRKRRCPSSSPMVLLEDITHKSSKLIQFTGSKPVPESRTRQGSKRYEEKLVNGDSTSESLNCVSYKPKVNQTKSLPDISDVVENSHPRLPSVHPEESASEEALPKFRRTKPTSEFTNRRTPAIKISIGDGAILKIPPRLPETEFFSINNSSVAQKFKTSDVKESQIHKKAKKSARKSRDKERHRSVDTINGSMTGPSIDSSFNKSQKKHKKKHRHRPKSLDENPPQDSDSPTQNIDNPPILNSTSNPLQFVNSPLQIVDNPLQFANSPLQIVDNPFQKVDNSRMVEDPSLNNNTPVEVKDKTAHQQLPTKIKVGDVFIDVVNISDSESDRESSNKSVKDENHENTSPSFEGLTNNRPRLVYTLKQDQGLSRVATTPRGLSPDYSSCYLAKTSPRSQGFSPEQSSRYLVKTSPSIMPMTNSPHRRKNASPGRVVSASPSVHYANPTNCLLKDYPLRSRTGSSLSSQPADLLSLAEHNVMHPSEDSQSHSSGLDSHVSFSSEDSGEEQQSDDIFLNAGNLSHGQEEDKAGIKPLMMKIQTQNVSGCLLEEGREIRVGDIVWGKIQGFPWWPGRVSGITVTQRDNDVVITQLANVAWFGSNTMSHVHCCDLFPFLEEFQVRYNKKKKGQYRQAIKQATLAARRLHTESTDILDIAD